MKNAPVMMLIDIQMSNLLPDLAIPNESWEDPPAGINLRLHPSKCFENDQTQHKLTQKKNI